MIEKGMKNMRLLMEDSLKSFFEAKTQNTSSNLATLSFWSTANPLMTGSLGWRWYVAYASQKKGLCCTKPY